MVIVVVNVLMMGEMYGTVSQEIIDTTWFALSLTGSKNILFLGYSVISLIALKKQKMQDMALITGVIINIVVIALVLTVFHTVPSWKETVWNVILVGLQLYGCIVARRWQAVLIMLRLILMLYHSRQRVAAYPVVL